MPKTGTYLIGALMLATLAVACSSSADRASGEAPESPSPVASVETGPDPQPSGGENGARGTGEPSRFLVGFSDDAPKYEPREALAPALELGAGAFRITLLWEPGRVELAETDIAALDQAVNGTAGLRLVLAVYADSGTRAPTTDLSRQQYCGYVGSALGRYPTIRDVVIWNEPNKACFWQPQFNEFGTSAAPAAYVDLLADCWDHLHGDYPDVNLIAPATSPRGNDRPDAKSNVSHSPGNFIREMGIAYRASGRTRPLFDTVGHHAYGTHSAERPWVRHASSKIISIGDWDRLMAELADAFSETDQLIPGACEGEACPAIWYLEIGYQTIPAPGKAALYEGAETDAHPLVDRLEEDPGETGAVDEFTPDQATQVMDSVRLAFCQPHVEAYFSFLLWDEPRLARWQSAPLWVDRTEKGSYSAFKQVISEVASGSVDCQEVLGGGS